MEIIIKIKTAVKLPQFESITASQPFPFFNNSCPGRTESSVSVSGAPKKIDGIKSTNVCVIDIATIKTMRYIGRIDENKAIEEETRIAPTRFM